MGYTGERKPYLVRANPEMVLHVYIFADPILKNMTSPGPIYIHTQVNFSINMHSQKLTVLATPYNNNK